MLSSIEKGIILFQFVQAADDPFLDLDLHPVEARPAQLKLWQAVEPDEQMT